MRQFDHEKLDAYNVSIEFVACADEIVESLPRGRGHLADQLHRAATSIPLNLAEGAGEYSPKEKARFYRMALRSATECAAIGGRMSSTLIDRGHSTSIGARLSYSHCRDAYQTSQGINTVSYCSGTGTGAGTATLARKLRFFRC